MPRYLGWTYGAPVMQDRNLECPSVCSHVLRRDHPGYCTAEVGFPGGTYELSCIKKLDTLFVVANLHLRVFSKASLQKKKNLRWFITDLLDKKMAERG